jgi:uncharacterized protein YciI
MPYFVMIGRDRPGALERRQTLRPAHQAYFYAPQTQCSGVAGGPLLDASGQSMVGSMLVFEAVDRAAVERFIASDPYVLGDLFETVEIVAWRWGLGRPTSVLGAPSAEPTLSSTD